MNFRKFSRSTALVTVAALALGACGGPQTSTPASSPESETAAPEATQSEDERLSSFFEEVFEREVALSPIGEAQLGRKTDNYGKWDDFSNEAAAAENQRRA